MKTRAAVAGLACCLAAAEATAQHIRGRVSDATTKAPVATVRLDLAKGDRVLASIMSDSLGLFNLTVPRAGEYELRAIRLGYATTIIPTITVLGSETMEVELSLAVAAIPLQPLRVVARGRTPSRYLSDVGFYEREHNGTGTFLTRYEIEQRGGSQLSEVLRSVGGVRLVRADRTGRRFEVRLRSHRCAPAVYLDGTVVRASGLGRVTDMPIDDLVMPADIDGIEIYNGPSESPAEFNRDANCGVLAIWTRRRR